MIALVNRATQDAPNHQPVTDSSCLFATEVFESEGTLVITRLSCQYKPHLKPHGREEAIPCY